MIGLRKNSHGLGKCVLNPAISGGVTQGACAVAPGIDFYLHGFIISKIVIKLSMDLSKWIEKAKELLARIAEMLKAFAAVLGKVFFSLIGKAGPLTGRLLQILGSIRLITEKRSPMFFAIGGLAVLFLILLISALAINFRGPRANVDVSAGSGIPPEELFIPDEPDFLPDFLFEREPRRSWFIEDIRPYWIPPADHGFWQGIVRSTVDELMEAVP